MYQKIILTILLGIFLTISVSGQVIDSVNNAQGTKLLLSRGHFQSVTTKCIPIYANGPTSCKTCECYFNNLFRSWTKKNVENYKEIKPLSYKAKGIIKDSAERAYYIKLLLDSNAIICGHSSGIVNGHTNIGKATAHSYKEVFASLAGIAREQAVAYLEHMVKRIRIGDKVYLLKVKIKNKIVDDYVIFSGKDNMVVWDDMFYDFWVYKTEYIHL